MFALADWVDHLPDARALAGGGVAVPSAGSGPLWRGVVASGETVEQPAPQWLASRRGFALMRGGRAMAFGKEILAADGTLCGTLDLRAPLLGVGLDGRPSPPATRRPSASTRNYCAEKISTRVSP